MAASRGSPHQRLGGPPGAGRAAVAMEAGAEDAAGIEGVAVLLAWFMACMVRCNNAQVLNEFDIVSQGHRTVNPRAAVRELGAKQRAACICRLGRSAVHSYRAMRAEEP